MTPCSPDRPPRYSPPPPAVDAYASNLDEWIARVRTVDGDRWERGPTAELAAAVVAGRAAVIELRPVEAAPVCDAAGCATPATRVVASTSWCERHYARARH